MKHAKKISILLFASILLNLFSGFITDIQSVQAAPETASSSIVVASATSTPTIYVDKDQSDIAVIRAVEDLKKDIDRVTTSTVEANIVNDKGTLESASGTKIIVGTIGHSEVIDQMVEANKIPQNLLSNIQGKGKWSSEGKWESSIRVVVDGQIVIIGSDPRGTIYGIYDLSEELGVSPWYFWGDVTPEKRDTVSVNTAEVVRVEPDVQYRGIFINDEVNLMWWSKAIDPEFSIGPETYKLVYELMSRLNINLLKPAMHTYSDEFLNDPNWSDSIDPLINVKNADEYGVVIGSAQPMFRKNENEWAPFAAQYKEEHNLDFTPEFDYSYEKYRPVVEAYWEAQVEALAEYEVAWSLGMRGKGDGPIEVRNPEYQSDAKKAELVDMIITKQQEILAEHINGDTDFTDGIDLNGIFQTFEVYKEVLTIYNAGLNETLSEEAAIIWSEDNHGNIRQFPNEDEQARAAGNTLYYHLSYWGSPQSYLWLYTTPLSKVGSELDRAYENGIQRAWIFNVGDIKPAEMALEFCIDKAWDVEGNNKDNTVEYVEDWNGDIFGAENAKEIEDIISTHYSLGIARRPQFTKTDTFSQEYFGDEWTKRMVEYEDIFLRVNQLYENDYKGTAQDDSFYQLVVYPVRGAYYANLKFYYQELYNLYKEQGRGIITNYVASMANEAQEGEFAETKYYNEAMSEGKWEGIMDPYSKSPNGQNPPDAPKLASLPAITITADSNMGVISEVQNTSGEKNELAFSSITQDSHFIDIFSTGGNSISWSAQTDVDWLALSQTMGNTINERVWVSVDWNQVPAEAVSNATITILCQETKQEIKVKITADNSKNRADYEGYVESDGYISIEAENFDRSTKRGDHEWVIYEDLGRENAAMMTYPVSGARITENISTTSPELQYDINFDKAGTYDITFYRMPTLDGTAVRFAYALDDGEPIIVSGTKTSSGDWSQNVLEGIEKLTSEITIPSAGKHTLKVWMVDPAVSFDQIVIETVDGIPSTYMAPPESYHSTKNMNPGQVATELSLEFDEMELILNQAEGFLRITNLGDGLGQYSQEKFNELKVATDALKATLDNPSATEENKIQAKEVVVAAMSEFSSSRKMTDGVNEYLIYEDFDWRQAGNDTNGLSATGASIVSDDRDDTNAVLNMTGDLFWNFPLQNEAFTVEYELKTIGTTWTNLPYIYKSGAYAGTKATPGPCVATEGSNFKVHNGSGWQTKNVIQSNQWATVKIEIDTPNKTFDFYYNDELIADDYGFRDKTLTELGQIWMGGSNAGRHFQLDNMKVYQSIAGTRVSLNKEQLNLVKGFSEKLEATITPSDTEVGGLSWNSDNEAVATVDNEGNVTAISAGKAVITVKANDNDAIKANCTVTVIDVANHASIVEATNLLETVEVGTEPGQYPNDVYRALQDAKENAITILTDQTATEAKKAEAIQLLDQAITRLKAAKIPEELIPEYLVQEDFEARLESQDMTGIEGDHTKMEIVKDGEDAVMSAKTQFNFFIDAQDKVLITEYDFRVMNNAWTSFPTMYDGPFKQGERDLPAVSLVTASADSQAKIRVRDPEINNWKDVEGGAINVGEWYHVKIEVDVVNQTYDYYLNDVLLVEDIGFRSKDAKVISQINFGGGDPKIDFQLDDLKIYTLKEVEPEPEPQTYAVTVNGGTTSKATAVKDEIITITATVPDGKEFVNWTSADGVVFAEIEAKETTFKMPEKAVTITANYKDKVVTPPVDPNPTDPTDPEDPTDATDPSDPDEPDNSVAPVIPVQPSVDGIKAEAKVEDSEVTDALSNAKDNGKGQWVKIEVGNVDHKVKEVVAEFSINSVEALLEAETKGLQVNTGKAVLEIDMETLKVIQSKAGESVSITVKQLENTEFSDVIQERVGNRPVFEFTIESAGERITSFGTGKIRVTIPYELAEGESAEDITVYYIQSDNTLIEMTDCAYDAINKVVTFTTDHFSRFAVGEKKAEAVNPPIEVKPTPTEPSVIPTTDNQAPETGDETSFLAVYILILSLIGIGIGTFVRRRVYK